MIASQRAPVVVVLRVSMLTRAAIHASTSQACAGECHSKKFRVRIFGHAAPFSCALFLLDLRNAVNRLLHRCQSWRISRIEFPLLRFPNFSCPEIVLGSVAAKCAAKNLKIQKPNARLWLLVDKSHIAMFTRYKSKIKTRHPRGGNGQWSREASMLERSAGLNFFVRADAMTRLRRVGAPIGGISLLFLELGGCMTLGIATPPPVADSPSASDSHVTVSAVADSRPLPLRTGRVSNPAPAMVDTISTYVGSPPAKAAPREKKREHHAQNAPQVASAAPVSQAKGGSIDPERLIGMAPGAVRELLGPPLRIESYDLSREWVYASNGCSFRIFFYPNLNTAAFRVLKYGGNDGNGELMDVSDVCIRHILTARKNATG